MMVSYVPCARSDLISAPLHMLSGHSGQLCGAWQAWRGLTTILWRADPAAAACGVMQPLVVRLGVEEVEERANPLSLVVVEMVEGASDTLLTLRGRAPGRVMGEEQGEGELPAGATYSKAAGLVITSCTRWLALAPARMWWMNRLLQSLSTRTSTPRLAQPCSMPSVAGGMKSALAPSCCSVDSSWSRDTPRRCSSDSSVLVMGTYDSVGPRPTSMGSSSGASASITRSPASASVSVLSKSDSSRYWRVGGATGCTST
mmetsp:Transcript_3464/g.8629  ORF Transcript_3464/g.8629 Transcript_3464/m.8629 type:complete len:258 (+) Transcript_3464:1199-1972(+)